MTNKNEIRIKAEIFQTNLKVVFTVLGVTQSEMSDIIGVSRQSMSAWVNQKTRLPTTAYLAMVHVCKDIIGSQGHAGMNTTVDIFSTKKNLHCSVSKWFVD